MDNVIKQQTSSIKWPLNVPQFSLWDRLKIAWFILNPKNRWTMGPVVQKFEEAWAEYKGYRYACLVSSGSAANMLIAQRLRERFNNVVVPAITWPTSINCWKLLGYDVHFLDVNPETLCMTVPRAVSSSTVIFPTIFLGLDQKISDYTDVWSNVVVDNCENVFGDYLGQTCSTSLYFGHQATTGTEGGLIFTNDKEDFKFYLRARNHGLCRSLNPYFGTTYRDFSFSVEGSNYKSNDIAAYMGLLNLKTLNWQMKCRSDLYDAWLGLCPGWLVDYEAYAPYGIPLVTRDPSDADHVWSVCSKLKIEIRPFPVLSPVGLCPAADALRHGYYIGLYPQLEFKQLQTLARALNESRRH